MLIDSDHINLFIKANIEYSSKSVEEKINT